MPMIYQSINQAVFERIPPGVPLQLRLGCFCCAFGVKFVLQAGPAAA